MSEENETLGKGLFWLSFLIISFAFLYVILSWQNLDDFTNVIINSGFEGPGIFFLLVFAIIGVFISYGLLINLAEEFLPKTKARLNYDKKCKELKKKYKSREVRKLKREEAEAEYKLEEARNALKELKND